MTQDRPSTTAMEVQLSILFRRGVTCELWGGGATVILKLTFYLQMKTDQHYWMLGWACIYLLRLFHIVAHTHTPVEVRVGPAGGVWEVKEYCDVKEEHYSDREQETPQHGFRPIKSVILIQDSQPTATHRHTHTHVWTPASTFFSLWKLLKLSGSQKTSPSNN